MAEFMKDEKSMVANRELDEAVWHIWRRRIEPSVRERLAAKPEQAAKRMMLMVMSPTAEDVQRDRITKELALLDKPGIEAVETVQKLIRRMIFLRITAYGDAYKKTLEEFAYTEVTIPFDIADYSRKHLKYHNSLEAWTIRALKELEVARSNSPSVQAELKASLPKQDPEKRKHTLKLVEMAEADLKKNPDNYAALQLRSMTHYYRGDFAEALNDIELARQLAPANIGSIMRFEQLRYLRAMNRDKDADALDDAIMNDSPAAAFYLISLADGKELREALAVDETIQTMLMDRPNATIRKLFAANPGIAAKRLSAYLMLPKLDAEWQKRIEAELKELGQVAVDHLKDQRKQLTGARVNLVEDEFDREKARRQRQLSQVLELAVERIDRILNR